MHFNKNQNLFLFKINVFIKLLLFFLFFIFFVVVVK